MLADTNLNCNQNYITPKIYISIINKRYLFNIHIESDISLSKCMGKVLICSWHLFCNYVFVCNVWLYVFFLIEILISVLLYGINNNNEKIILKIDTCVHI